MNAVEIEEAASDLVLAPFGTPEFPFAFLPAFGGKDTMVKRLWAGLEAAGDNVRKLKNVRCRISRIRIFDPACGSGNFQVIPYIQLRQIEAKTVRCIDNKLKPWIGELTLNGSTLSVDRCAAVMTPLTLQAHRK